MKFQRYKRGSLVMVNFSPSMGSELKGKHLAVVLTKKDSPNNSVLTVVPLSSKEKTYYLDLGTFLSSEVIPYLKKYNEQHKNSLTSIQQELEYHGETIELKNKLSSLQTNINQFNHVLTTYENMNKKSFAMVQNITTISKLRVLKPMNEFDPILNIKVSKKNLDSIDSKIIQLFTAYNI